MSLAHVGAEAYRLRLLTQLERELRLSGFRRVAGVDEAGRGSLAGPVVAAAVIPHPEKVVAGVDDSKRLSPDRREQMADRIRDAALSWCVVPVSASLIDRINILQATRRAMRGAIVGLDPGADVAVVDAVSLDCLEIPTLAIVRGDLVSYAVACASILAKTERDRMMCELHQTFPRYGFEANKGYGAPEHLEALGMHGPCPYHRLTFKSVLPTAEC